MQSFHLLMYFLICFFRDSLRVLRHVLILPLVCPKPVSFALHLLPEFVLFFKSLLSLTQFILQRDSLRDRRRYCRL